MTLIAETDIAVIGMSCRFPGAKDPAAFWSNLIKGRESITFFTRDELIAAGQDVTLIDRRSYVPARGVLEDIEKFDAVAFDMTPAEAAMTDPQHRLFLECSWEAMEDGGYDGSRYKGPVGVYGGCGANTYLHDHVLAGREQVDLAALYQMMQANQNDFLATKTAYKLNLTGPAMTVQTACSTSLVAVHCACQAIINGECDMALAGGVSIILPQIAGYLYQEGMILSADGHCRAFDASASGTVMGSGCGVVLLKRLEEAVQDRDYVYGVIKGGAINNDGAGKVGFTAPGVEGQVRVIHEALAVSAISPASIGYVETHGTGTAMGDPVEIEALRRVFRKADNRYGDCLIGSVKTNIGHCDAASGIAGLIKTMLVVKNGTIPASLHYEKPNQAIDFTATPFRVCTQASHWEDANGPRFAGVSSFGMGGTNAHLVLQQPPVRRKTLNRRTCSLLPISGKSIQAVERYIERLTHHMREFTADDVADIAFTFQNGRRQLNHRMFHVCGDREDALAALSENMEVDGDRYCNVEGKTSPVITFMFPGQGSQYVGMGLELNRTEKVFKDAMDLCAEIVRPELNADIRQYINTTDKSLAEELNQTAVAQPVLFSVEYSYAMLLASWGIHPQAVIGHSLGEYVAACLAGIFSLPDALRLVVARGKLMQKQPKGKMVAVMLPEEKLEPLLQEGISVAAVNGMSSTLSGSEEAIQTVIDTCETLGFPHAVLKTSHAFHSSMFDGVVDEFAAIVESVTRNEPGIPVISNVTGRQLSAQEAMDHRYWARQLRHTVRFGDGLQTLLTDPDRILVEVGPGTTLSGMARQIHPLGKNQHVIATGRHAHDKNGCSRALFTAIGRLWSLGAPVDWRSFSEDDRSMRLSLPTYPFEREEHWLAAAGTVKADTDASSGVLPSDQWLYSPDWRRLPPLEPENRLDTDAHWLLLGDAGPVSLEIARVLQARTSQQSTVELKVLPEGFSELIQLISSYFDSDTLHIVYLPSLKVPPAAAVLPEEGIRFAIALARALAQHTPKGEVFCDILTSGIYDITGEEQLIAANAALVAAARSLNEEYSSCHCRCIDCGLTDRGTAWPGTQVEKLADELMIGNRGQNIVLRGGHRWLEQYQTLPATSRDTAFRNKGTYLITGGLGDIGLAFAEYISSLYQVNLVLTRRSPFPAEDYWHEWLRQNGEHLPDSSIIRRLMAIQEQGTEVMTAAVDVCSREKMQLLLDRIESRFGKLNGCIHAAGVTGASALGSFSEMTVERFENILAPKYEGYCNLRDLLAKRDTDFLIAMSSLASILGGTGMGGYGAANAVMSAQITLDNREGGVWLCIDWDGWRFRESFSGELMENRRLSSLVPATIGVQLLSRLTIIKSSSRIAVSTTSLNNRLHRSGNVQSVHSPAAGSADEPEDNQNKDAPENVEEELLAGIWRSVLGTKAINRQDSFFSLGGNSLQITQVHSRLKESLGFEFPLRSLFEAPRLMDMAAVIRQYTVQSVKDSTTSREEMEF